MAIRVSNGTKTFEVDESNLDAAKADGFVPTVKVTNGKIEHDVHPDKLFAAEKDGFKPLSKPRKMEAALEGFGEGATLGYLNNLQALAEKPITAVLNAVTGNDVEADDYVTARDSFNRRQKSLQEENPGSFAVGQVAGTMASSIPVARAAQGATVAARAVRGAGAGAAYGAAQNTSEQEGEMGGVDLGERAQNAAIGGVFGAGASLGTDAIAKGARAVGDATAGARKAVGEKLKDIAETQAFKATGAMLKDFRKSDAKGEINEIGRYLLDKGIIKVGDSVDDIAAKTLKYKQAAGESLDQVYSSAEDSLKTMMGQKGFDPIRDKKRIMDAARAELGDTVGAEGALNKLSTYLDDVASQHGDKPYQQALAKYSKEKQKYIQDVRQYRRDLADYRRQVGAAGDDIDQGLLPSFSDDMQRTGQRGQQVELHGRPASQMEAEPLELWTQQELTELPQRGQAAFNSARGDDLLPLAQQMEMDQRYLRELGDGYQGEILNTRMTPKSYGEGSVPTMNQGRGQMQFAISPNKPVRPQAPEQVRNAMSPRRSNEIKGALDEQINYARNPLSKEPASEKAFVGARRELNKIVDEAIDELGGSEASKALKAANKEYGLSSRVNQMAQDRVNRESANKLFGLTDTITAGAGTTYGAVTGDWQTAVVAMAGKKAIEKYGTTGIAKLADAASKKLLQQPRMAQLAKANPEAYRATVFSLVDRLAERGSSGQVTMPRAAENKPQKGPDKWVLDGIEKLNQAGIPQDHLETLRQSKSGRDLLIEASDAAPGSKRMESVLRRIRTATAQGGQ